MLVSALCGVFHDPNLNMLRMDVAADEAEDICSVVEVDGDDEAKGLKFEEVR